MRKPYTESDLSDAFDRDLIWRRKELSDLKLAIRKADSASKSALLKSLVAMSYAHWEGFVKMAANKYFEHLTIRKRPFSEFERQFYINSMLAKLDSVSSNKFGLREKCDLIDHIIGNQEARFSYINENLVNTKSNLNSEVVSEICLVCGVSDSYFKSKKDFIDVLLLKRRNAIAHGKAEDVQENSMDDFVAEVLSLMGNFRDLLENKISTKSYCA